MVVSSGFHGSVILWYYDVRMSLVRDTYLQSCRHVFATRWALPIAIEQPGFNAF